MNQALIGVGCKDGVAGLARRAVNVILPFDVMNPGSRAVVMRGLAVRCSMEMADKDVGDGIYLRVLGRR